MSTEKIPTFETTDFTKRAEVLLLFPSYIQEKVKVEGDKKVTNTIDIECFTLQTPYKDKTLLLNTNLFLEQNKRQCLFGRNGSGKTLLFERMIDYSIKGFPKHVNVHHLHEMEHKEVCENVFDTVLHSHGFMMLLRRINKKLAVDLTTEKDEARLTGLKDTQMMVDSYMKTVSSDDAEDRIEKMLRALGFDEFGMKVPTNDLSGGLRMRVALAVAFFAEADLLLLDEPTNHLDFPSVLWLENRLRAYRGSFLLVTHDRDLLINTTTSTLLLEDQKIVYYTCGFGEFEKRKAKEDLKKDTDIEKFIKANRNADPSTQTGRKLYDMKAWQQRYQKKMVQMQGKFTFPPATPLEAAPGDTVLADGSVSLIKLTDVRFSYNVAKGLPFIFDKPISFEVTTKSRVGIMGPNGAGKSTLLKLITKKIIPTEGTFKEHPTFVTAYFGQHSTAELDMTKTPMEFMMEQFPDAKSNNLRDHLAKTGVDEGVESTRMANLSYSQRSCVIFSKLTFICPHLLIMDEPTNFLDLESVDSLIAAANKFPGALLVVTHSRGFLRKCAKSFLSVVPGQFLSFENMKEAEAATYTFIQELESGVKFDAAAMKAGGGSMASHNERDRAEDGRPQTAAVAAVAEVIVCPEAKFAVGEKVESLWTDKKFHEAEIVSIVSAKPIKYSVFFPEFDKKANIPEAGIKKHSGQMSVEAKAAAIAAKKDQDVKDAKAAADKKWAAGDKCMAQKADGKFYPASITKVNGFDMYVIEYESPKETATVAIKKIRLAGTAAAGAPVASTKAPAAAASTKAPAGNTNKGKAQGGRAS